MGQSEKPHPYLQVDLESGSTQGYTTTTAKFGNMGNKFSITVRIQPESIGGLRYIFNMSTNVGASAPNNGTGVYMRVNNAGQLFVRCYLQDNVIPITVGNNNDFTSTTVLSAGTIYHVTVHFDSNNATAANRIRMDIDGVAETPSASNLGFRDNILYGSEGFAIGATVAGAGPFDGRIYALAVSASGTQFSTSDTRDANGAIKDYRLFGSSNLHSYFDILDGDDTHDFVLGTSTWTAFNSPLVEPVTLDLAT